MPKILPILVAILVLSVSWIFFTNFSVVGWNELRVTPRNDAADSVTMKSIRERVTELVQSAKGKSSPVERRGPDARDRVSRIRVATFNARVLDRAKLSNPGVVKIVVRMGREFDVLALQQIQPETHSVLPSLVRLMNSAGDQFDYAIGPRVGPEGAQEQYAFIFNRRAVMIDRNELYTVDDRSNLLSFEPFVGWFRTVSPPEKEAFTFSLINLRVDEATALQEHGVLDDLLVAARDDGRGEDDVILAGDLQARPGELGDLDEWVDVGFAVENSPTGVAAGAAWDNVVFQKIATSEFTGNSGVLDFLREYNLSMEQALEVSDHLVAWAEFSIYEGGEAGRIARQSKDQLDLK